MAKKNKIVRYDLTAPDGTKRDGSGAITMQPEPFQRVDPLTTPILPNVSQSFTSLFLIAKNVLANPDVAYQADRELQEQMMHDPMVMGPLQKRLLAMAQLEFEVTPEDAKDVFQVQVAKTVEKIFRRIPRIREFFRSLGMATLRGTSASEVNWKFNTMDRLWEVNNHKPFHGDKITYDIWGNPRLLTRDYQTGGRELDKSERDRLIIHTFDRDDGMFYNAIEAGYVYRGRGLRDTIWPYWFLKQNALKFWVTLLERHGTGWMEGRFQMGNASQEAAITSVLQNLVQDSKYSLPVPPGVPVEEFGITSHSMEGVSQSADLFIQFVENWAGKHIRLVIEGQTQTTQESGDGLGSGRAEALENTFQMYCDYDACLMEDTITDQLIQKIQWFNFGALPFKTKFSFMLKKLAYDEQQKRVEAAQKARMRVPRKWLYETLDIPQLNGDEPEEEVVDFGANQQQQLPGPQQELLNLAGKGDGFLDSHAPKKYSGRFNRLFEETRNGQAS